VQFLDPTKTNVIAMYCAIFGSHWLFFGLVWGLFKLRDWMAPMASFPAPLRAPLVILDIPNAKVA